MRNKSKRYKSSNILALYPIEMELIRIMCKRIKQEGKGRIAAKIVWGLGERICRDDFSRRWVLFKYFVQNVMAYGVEI